MEELKSGSDMIRIKKEYSGYQVASRWEVCVCEGASLQLGGQVRRL